MLPGEVRRPELIPLATGSSPLGRTRAPYIYPAVSGVKIGGRKEWITGSRLCFVLTGT